MLLNKNIIISAAALGTVLFASCNQEDVYFKSSYQSEPISITQVYLEDYKSDVPDRPVDFARLGQMLRLEGKGFMGLKKAYINGYDTYFNRAYVTDNSMIISINTNTPVTECDPEVRNTIHLVKDGTELVYEFVIRNGYSSIQQISNTLPKEGETVILYGSYLQEPDRILLPGGIVADPATYSYDKDGEWCSFVMPSGVSEGGSVVFESPNGISQSPAYFNEKRGMLLDFDEFNKQGAWSWSETGSMISSNREDGDLVEDPLGENGWCVQIVPDRLLAEGIPANKTRVTECHTAGDGDAAWEDWTRLTGLIPADTPVSEVAFQFDILCPDPWTSGGMLQIQSINNYSFSGFGSDDDNNTNGQLFIWAPWLETGSSGAIVPFQAETWTTVTIPWSKFHKYANAILDGESPTFQTIIDDRNAATYPNFGIGFSNKDFSYTNESGSSVDFNSFVWTGPKIYLDNWRIVPYKAFDASDYPEDEEESPAVTPDEQGEAE